MAVIFRLFLFSRALPTTSNYANVSFLPLRAASHPTFFQPSLGPSYRSRFPFSVRYRKLFPRLDDSAERLSAAKRTQNVIKRYTGMFPIGSTITASAPIRMRLNFTCSFHKIFKIKSETIVSLLYINVTRITFQRSFN